MTSKKTRSKRRRKQLSPMQTVALVRFGAGLLLGALARMEARHRNPIPPTVPALPPLRPLGRIIDVEAIVKDKGA